MGQCQRIFIFSPSTVFKFSTEYWFGFKSRNMIQGPITVQPVSYVHYGKIKVNNVFKISHRKPLNS